MDNVPISRRKMALPNDLPVTSDTHHRANMAIICIKITVETTRRFIEFTIHVPSIVYISAATEVLATSNRRPGRIPINRIRIMQR